MLFLGPEHFPLGGYGYVNAAIELTEQLQISHKHLQAFDEIYIGSGSALTHAGCLLTLFIRAR